MKRWLGFALLLVSICVSARADESTEPKHLLQYKFQPGEVVRWKVTHRARVNTTVSGTSQTAETTSDSVKVWKVLPSSDPKKIRFEHAVEKVEMRQKLTGREEVVYNSETDAKPPLGFEDAAKNVGVTLAIITIDRQGNVIERSQPQRGKAASDSDGQIVVPLPAEAVPVGHVWSFPYDVNVTLRSGEARQVKTRQRFTLEEVNGGIATIGVETQVLSPVNNPEIEAQLIQRETSGKVRFDIAAGRIVGQQMDLDKSVLGFSGESSSLHYVMRFTEELLSGAKTAGPAPPAKAKTAQVAKPQGPAPPPQTGKRPQATGGFRRR